ncbi:MAG: DUF1353 domain-containing protein [Alphaproteobacteria bacterium]|nr:DUF1353 domain-containing protein [Alphaproteobacteria bacterium]
MDTYNPNIENPYPEGEWSEISDFKYLTPMILRREAEAVRNRGDKEKDAEYILGEEYRVSYKLDGQDREIKVPRGMLTDLSSAPRIATLAGIGRVGPHLEASIVHDFLYIAWQYLEPKGTARSEDRRFVDKLFRVAMKEASVVPFRREIIYWAVRWFGGSFYESEDPNAFVDLDAA